MGENQPKSRRGKSFTCKQDRAICYAYLNITQDLTIENSQSSGYFWNRIYEHYIGSTCDDARSQVSIQSRWGTIMKYCNKFFGFLSQIQNAHQSGMNEANVVMQAKIMYMEIEKKPFSFDHWWGILESSIKWQQLPGTNSRTNTPTMTIDFIHQSATQVPNSVSLADDHDTIEESPGRTEETGDISGTRDRIESSRRKRPPERKADKTARKKSKIGDRENVRVSNLMEEFNTSFSENAKAKSEREERKLKVMEDLKKIEEDKRMKDVTTVLIL
ncbi:hypothetical protein Droror1_Dr00004253 [Drosera rotundifolia]